MPREADIQRRIVLALQERGAYVVKVVLAGRVGVADLLVCYQGRFFALEVKQPGAYPTKIQRYELEQAARAGAVALVVRSVADAIAAIGGISV